MPAARLLVLACLILSSLAVGTGCESGERVVYGPVVTVVVQPDSVSLGVGATRTLIGHVDGPADARRLVWACSDTTVALVAQVDDTTALVTGRAPGAAVVRAISSVDMARSDSTIVRVSGK